MIVFDEAKVFFVSLSINFGFVPPIGSEKI